MALQRPKLLLKRFSRPRQEETPNEKQTPQKKPVEASYIEQRKPREDELALGFEYVAEDEERGRWLLTGIKQNERLVHFYIVGASGSGKTKFMQYLIKQDIANQNGFGVIDPHGDLIEDIKGWLYLESTKDLQKDVVLLDPADSKKTAVFNPIEQIEGETAGDQAGKLMIAFDKIWHEFFGPRMENILRNSLIALCEAGLTIAEVPLLLMNADFRQKVLEKVEEPNCRRYFLQEFETLSSHTRREYTESTLNKINALLSRERIRQILSARKSSFDLREIMDKQKILLVNLNKGRLGDTGDLLGSLLMSRIQMAAFSRTDMPERKRTPFYLYIDEFQNFASENFISVLSEARKYGLSLILAHQNLAQLPRSLQSSIITNCGVQTYFRLSRTDADILAREGFRVSGLVVKYMNIGADSVSPVYETLQEEREKQIQGLQDLPRQFCFAVNKNQSSRAGLQVPPVPKPWQAAGKDADDFEEMVQKAEIGKGYLVPRGKIEKECRKRQEELTKHEDPDTFRDTKRENT